MQEVNDSPALTPPDRGASSPRRGRRLPASSPPPSDPRSAQANRLFRIYSLPGGVRRYKDTLDAILAFLAEGPATYAAFERMLAECYAITGRVPARRTLRLLETTGFVRLDAQSTLLLTPLGERIHHDPDPEIVFDHLASTYQGLLETLVLIDIAAPLGTERAKGWLEKLLGRTWKSPEQVHLRRNWLLSLGLTDRDERGDRITPLGRQSIERYPDLVAELYRRIDDIFDEEFEALCQDVEWLEPDEDDEEDEEKKLPEPEPRRRTAPPPVLHDEPASPPGWWADRVDLLPERLRPLASELELESDLLERASAALAAGKHLLLVGPPGTGKTELALRLGEAAQREGYCRGTFVATGSADWSTFDTLGGYAMDKDGALHFRPGIFLTAIQNWQWLLVDELNRADLDRAFGELLTVLAGRGIRLPFTLDDGKNVSVGPEANATHRVPPSFRMLGTMNTWDKSSLFRLSYALQRRFSILHIGVPEPRAYARLLERHATRPGHDPKLSSAQLARLTALFSNQGILHHRAIGPAIAIDMIRYWRARGGADEGLAEAIGMHLLPQLEGLEADAAETISSLFDSVLEGLDTSAARAELEARMRELFSHLGG